MFSVKSTKKILRFLVPLFIAIFSVCVCANKYSELEIVQDSLESIEENNDRVLELTAATLGLSAAITILPDDICSSIANAITDLDKYFVFILIALFVEKLIVLNGSKLAFMILIPAACVLYFIGNIAKKKVIKKFASSILILGLALVVVIPGSNFVVDTWGKSYMATVDDTIQTTKTVGNQQNGQQQSTEKNLIKKMSNAVKQSIDSVGDIAENFKAVVQKCFTSIAIMVVFSCVIPLLVFVFFIWLIKQLFNMNYLIVYEPQRVNPTEVKPVISEVSESEE